MSLYSRISNLFQRSVAEEEPRDLPTGDDFRSGYRRQLAIPQVTQTRWELRDLEGAIRAADTGQLRLAARLCESLRRDGVIHGVLSTRSLGLVQLPLRFKGDPDLVEGAEEDFRTTFPDAEVAMLDSDGILLGAGVGEFVTVDGARPVLRRLDPQWLWYRWSEDRWYYQSIQGMLPINPGDGRWVLHCPGGSVKPWGQGLWMALGRAFIAKEHAYFLRENYSQKLANAARVAVSPQGASDAQAQGWFEKVAQWGVNTVFGLRPGWDVRLLESNGRGYEIYKETIESANEEIIITLAGQLVTTTGGSGFISGSMFQAIAGDLIQGDGNALAGTLNAQGLHVWANARYGAGAYQRARAGRIAAAWDVTPPQDLNAKAAAMTAAATAAKSLNEVLERSGQEVDMVAIVRQYGVPVRARDAAPPSSAPAGETPAPASGLRAVPSREAA
ncbi:MAG TPA: hypothetical protein VF765_31145 [Polyangiaceae bacterium]